MVLWRVVGGRDRGGIIVRSGVEVNDTSRVLVERLGPDAVVKELARRHERLQFKKVSGSGPETGWVSITLRGKKLLEEVQHIELLRLAESLVIQTWGLEKELTTLQEEKRFLQLEKFHLESLIAFQIMEVKAASEERHQSRFHGAIRALKDAIWAGVDTIQRIAVSGLGKVAETNTNGPEARGRARSCLSGHGREAEFLTDDGLGGRSSECLSFEGEVNAVAKGTTVASGIEAVGLSSLLPPPEGVDWRSPEHNLWLRTGCVFNPLTAVCRNCWISRSPRGTLGRVSVLTPTTESRSRFHKLLWECFEAQTWRDKELVVVETFVTQPSRCLLDLADLHPHLIYVGLPAGSADLSIGLKRNIGISLASGEFLAHFDDDDLYAPRYLHTMHQELEREQAVALTLSSWFVLDMRVGEFCLCDPGLALQGDNVQLVKEMQYGFGFSYFYRKETALLVSFADKGMGEDYDFYCRVMDLPGQNRVELLQDKWGLCLHIQHKNEGERGGNTSDSNVCKLRDVTRSEIEKLEFRHCPGFDMYSQLSSLLVGMLLSPNQANPNITLHTLVHTNEEWTPFAEIVAENARRRYFIIGNWDGWDRLHEIRWDSVHGCLSYDIPQEARGDQSFQIVMDGDWNRCIHPYQKSAAPSMDVHRLCGPDGAGYGKDWIIKRPIGQKGIIHFRVLVMLAEDFRIQSVTWRPHLVLHSPSS